MTDSQHSRGEDFATLRLADSTHGFHSLTAAESRAVASVPAILDRLKEQLEALREAVAEHLSSPGALAADKKHANLRDALAAISNPAISPALPQGGVREQHGGAPRYDSLDDFPASSRQDAPSATEGGE